MAVYDVFVSYAHVDAEAVDPLVAALRRHGLSVWQDRGDIDDFASITLSIADGLASSKAMLAYYSMEYRASRACQWELTAAFIAAQHRGEVRKRVLVVNPDASAGHIDPIELRDARFLAPGDEAQMAEKIASHVAKLDRALGDARALTPQRWYGRKPSDASGFVGRERDLWAVHSALTGPDVAIISGQAATDSQAQISGLGGIGKSMLAEEYAKRFGAAYPGGVFWLRAYGNDDTKATLGASEREKERQSQMRAFAAELGSRVEELEELTPGQIDARVFATIKDAGERCLWVVDDLPSDLDEDQVKHWACRASAGRTLYTTRSRQYPGLAPTIDLDVLDEDAGYALLTRRRPPDGAAEEAAARDTVADLGGHPLALAVAAGALEKLAGLYTYAGFRAELATTDAQALALAEKLTDVLPTGHGPGIVATMLYSIRQLGPEGLDFLRVASVLAPAPIPPSLVSDVLIVVDKLKSAQATTAAAVGMDQAGKQSLADINSEDGSRSVHTLVSRAVQSDDHGKARLTALRTAAVEVVARLMAYSADARAHELLTTMVLPHARELARRLETVEEATVYGRLANFDFVRGDYQGAAAGFRELIEARRRLLGDDDEATLEARCSLAGVMYQQDDLDGARRLLEDVRDTSRRVRGEDHPRCMDLLGLTLHAQGDFEGARQVQEKSVAALHELHGDDDHGTLVAMGNLASTLRDLGDLDRARDIQEQALQTLRRTLGGDHVHACLAALNLARTLRPHGDLEGARDLEEETVATLIEVVGEDHDYTLTAKANLALTYKQQGDLGAARSIEEQVLETRRRLFGEQHRKTVTAIDSLASTLEQQGDLHEVRHLREEVLAHCRRTYGDDHSETIQAVNELLPILLQLEDFEEMRTLNEHLLAAHRRSGGDDDPNAIIALGNIATALYEGGDAAQALPFQEEALELCLRVFGPDDEYTLGITSNLANCYAALEDFQHACSLLEQALAGYRRTVGNDHPSTVTITDILEDFLNSLGGQAIALRDEEDLDGARRLLEEIFATAQRIFGEDDPHTFVAMNNLATPVQDQGDLGRARMLLQQALDGLRRHFGDDDPRTQEVARRLQRVREDIRDRKGVKVKMLKKIRQADRRNDDADTLSSRNDLANTYLDKGEFDKAIPLFEATLRDTERMFGPEHTNTLSVRNNLASAYRSAGQVDRAISLFEAALADSKRVFGLAHVNTMWLSNNLALAYWENGERAKALRSLESAVESATRALGPDDELVLQLSLDLQYARQVAAG